MNSAEKKLNLTSVKALASVATIVRKYFPTASVNLAPWSNDTETQKWLDPNTFDLAFHFPGWNPNLQCRALLIQLIVGGANPLEKSPSLQGVIMRGMTFEGERWRLVTLGNWEPSGSFLPKAEVKHHLHAICKDLFALFSSSSA